MSYASTPSMRKDKILHYLKKMNLLGEWEIDKKLFSITVDNASANDSFVKKLKTQLNFKGLLLLLNGIKIYVRCCAYILNMIVQNGLTTIDHAMIKVCNFIKYIKGYMIRKQKFIDCVA